MTYPQADDATVPSTAIPVSSATPTETRPGSVRPLSGRVSPTFSAYVADGSKCLEFTGATQREANCKALRAVATSEDVARNMGWWA